MFSSEKLKKNCNPPGLYLYPSKLTDKVMQIFFAFMYFQL